MRTGSSICFVHKRTGRNGCRGSFTLWLICKESHSPFGAASGRCYAAKMLRSSRPGTKSGGDGTEACSKIEGDGGRGEGVQRGKRLRCLSLNRWFGKPSVPKRSSC